MVVVTRTPEYLEHHGIQGQKWGVRNGPPYPLDYEQHNSSEKSKNSKGSLDNYVNNNLKSRSGNSSTVKVKRSANTGEVGSDNSNKDSSNKSLSSDNSSSKNGLGLAIKETSEQEFRRNILKNNPNAAIADLDLARGLPENEEESVVKNFLKAHKKEIITGLAITAGAAVIAAGAAYVISQHKHAMKWEDLYQQQRQLAIDFDKSLNLSAADGSPELNGFSSKSQKFMAEWLAADTRRYVPISQKEFDALDDVGKTFDKGQQMFRMSMGEHNTLRDGLEYVSITPEDRNRYKGFLPQMWKTRGFNGENVYEAMLSANESIRIPSKKEAILLMEKAVEKVAPGHTAAVYHKDALDHFYEYCGKMTDRDAPIVKAFIDELKNAGYNAVVDYNDAGRLSDLPVILLDGAKSAKVNAANSVSMKEASEAFSNIKSLSFNSSFSVDDFNALPTAYKRLLNEWLAA